MKTWTWSAWVKRGSLAQAGTIWGSNFASGGFGLAFGNYGGAGVNPEYIGITLYAVGTVTTSAVFRDPSAWYHFVARFDSTQATQADRFRLYVNGVQQTLSGALNVTLNADYHINAAGRLHTIAGESGYYNDIYLAEINHIDGQSLTPSSFGETNAITGVWQPKRYAGTYGTNGYYLNFSDNSNNTAATIGKDNSGNGNNWTPNVISVTAGVTYDSMVDSPTVGATSSNYATLNPLDKTPASTTITASNGNLQVTSTNAGTVAECMAATIAIPANSGKWYWECQFTTENDAVGTPNTGIIDASLQITADCYLGSSAAPASIGFSCDGQIRTPTGNTSYTNPTSSQVVGFAYDSSNGKLWVAVAGTWQNSGNPAAGTGQVATASWYANGAKVANSSNRSLVTVFNFGQRPFTYTPPTGFVALNTQNLPTPTISNGANYMAATTYTGNGTTQSISNAVNGISFQPDFVWYKGRTTTFNHALFDSIRGTLQRISSNLTAAESTTAGSLTSFNSNGFAVGNDAGANQNTDTYVAWQWNAGGSTVTNTSGSISAQVRANPTSGFSIVTYTGTGANATVGHGLGVAPRMIIVKERSAAGDSWYVYHVSLGATNNIFLDSTAVSSASATAWNSTAPTSTVFSLGTSPGVNQSTQTYVAYCFAAVAGYSAFGSYIGNGAIDGTFVYLGFRPRYLLIKASAGTASSWLIIDTTRMPNNPANLYLLADSSGAEGPFTYLDITANGFKIRTTNSGVNTSTATYIYMAFAENPFKNSLAR
jgi:hypothetical protein